MSKKLLTKPEFAKLAGVGIDYIATYIKRGKLIENKDGKLDLSNQLNELFLQRRIEQGNNKGYSLTELEKLLKESELEKRNKEIELLTLKTDKLNGQLLPVDLFESVMAVNCKNFVLSFESATDKLLIVLSSKLKMSNEDKAEFRQTLVETINKAQLDAISASKKEVKNLVDEFKEQ
ncbi:MAG: hypothetical protein LC109_11130 [Bacteroidia bacterium]|nr:hypothetical protein [Bacteroidia bacterium]